MLFLFFALMLVDYTANKEKFLLEYRLMIAGMPVNIMDGLEVIAGLSCLLVLGRKAYQTETLHPGLKWCLICTAVAVVGGAVTGSINGVDGRLVVNETRNVVTMGLCVAIGYYTVSNLRAAGWAGNITLLCSAASALIVLLFFREIADNLKSQAVSLDKLRNTSTGGDSGVVGMAFVAFCMVAGLRFMPIFAALGLMALCSIGSFGLPHRSQWLAAVGSLLFAMVILPRVQVSRRIVATFTTGAVVIVLLIAGIITYSSVTGRNFNDYVVRRLVSLLPGASLEGKDQYAWATRVPAALIELKMFGKSPAFGGGFGIQASYESQYTEEGFGFNHNVWTSALAQGGVPLLMVYVLPVALSIVVGFRLVKARVDRSTVLIGAIGAINGVMCLLLATSTMSINIQRGAIPLGLICGLVLRTRQMQLAALREYDGYLDEPSPYNDASEATLIEEYGLS